MTTATLPVGTSEANVRPARSRLNEWIFGQEPAMRLNVQRTFLSFSNYLVWMVVEAICAHRGLISWSALSLMYGFNLFGNVLIYTLLRSGLSSRLRDSSMVMFQSVYALVALMLAYVLIPQTRAAVLQALCVVQVFGMFTLRPRETVVACEWSVALLLLTLLGMLWVRPAHFDVEHETINIALACIVLPALTAITRHFALLREKLAAQRAELKTALARVQELATRDALTNLTNRAHMQEILNQEILRHQRHGAVFCLALIDIDYFKRVNDKYGHQVGDEVLVGFAKTSAALQRQSDVMARWGGEEFLILLPQTPSDCALQALERLREAIAEARLSTSIPGLKVTISAGLAQWRSNEPLNQTMERADQALYAAKHNGRNRCVVAQ